MLQEIARTAGTTVEAVLHALIAQISLSRSAESGEAGAEAADSEAADSEAEDAEAEDAEAAAERRREQEEVEANIRRWHQERAGV